MVHELDALWVSDLTYIGTEEEWLYLANVMDTCSRKILGYEIGNTMEKKLFTSALGQAKATRSKVVLPRTIFHSVHGSQYASDDFRRDAEALSDGPIHGNGRRQF